MPISPYAVAKLAGEGYCSSFFRVFGLETVAVRYFNVFGPRQDPLSQYSAVIPRFITALQSGQAPIVYGDGEQSRDFTYIDNVIEGTVLAMSAPGVGGEVFNVAAGRRVTLNELLGHLRALVGAEVEAHHEEPRPGDVRHSHAQVTRAQEKLGYRTVVPVEDGLRRTLDWFGNPRP